MEENATFRSSASKSDGRTVTLDAMYDLLRKFRSCYEIRLRELDDKDSTEETQKIRVRILQSYINDLTAQNEELLKVAEDVESEANSRVHLLETKLEKATSALKICQCEKKISWFENEFRRHQEEKSQYLAEIIELQNTLRDLQTSDHSHHDLLKDELERRDETIQKLRQEVLQLQDKRDFAYDQLQNCDNKVHLIQKELLDANLKKEEALREVQVKRNQISDLEHELHNMKIQHADSFAQIEKLTVALQQLQVDSKETRDALTLQLREKVEINKMLKDELKCFEAQYKDTVNLSERYSGTIKQLQDEIQLTASLSQESKQRGVVESELVLHYQENYKKAVTEVEALKNELQETRAKLTRSEAVYHKEFADRDDHINKLKKKKVPTATLH